ncbi:MAG: PD40 domain-containing protein [Anaerolineae bacterium]|nr:PD40 domain-containing protein [Anaerolineae bacterium]
MKRALLLQTAVLALLFGVAVVMAQPAPENALFVPIGQIGAPRPQGIQYDPQFDRFAWVDDDGRLVLVDAASYQLLHTLYESGAYNAYRFSHDGLWLALAIDRRVELWETATGQRTAMFEPAGANLVQGPLHFTPDDRYLLLDTVVPAPQELRRSENDTSIIPWLWDLEAGRGERPSRYASLEDGYPFFEYRNGLVVGANTYLVGGIPNRLMVLDGGRSGFPVVGEISANRFERDPITVWRSAFDNMLYADPGNNAAIEQIDTDSGALFDLRLGINLNYRNLAEMNDFRLSRSARVLCPLADPGESSLLRLFHGEGYLSYQNYEPVTVMLLDVLQPLTMGQERGALLLYSFNEERGRGTIELIRPPDVQHMLLSPDQTRLMVRRASGEQAIELYDLQSCTLDLSIVPAEPDGAGERVLAFNADGSVIISDFQRFDAQNGDMLAYLPEYTRGFERFTFDESSQNLITIRGDDWQSWDISTGQPHERASLTLVQGQQIIARSPDSARYLTRSDENGDPAIINLIDIRQNSRRVLEIPSVPGLFIEQIIPNETWESLLVVYNDGFISGSDIAVYTFGRGQVLWASGDDLPSPDYRQYGWLDTNKIYVMGTPYYDQPERVYGVDYDPSGLPACLVRAFPDQAADWQIVWEAIRLRQDSEFINRLALRLCAALPETADAVVPALTPTPPFIYRSQPTPLPYVIPGVPLCLTEHFPFEATRYATLWREISAGLTQDQVAELEGMICEGLISSVNSIQPTPTINPNLAVPPTPTPIDAAPQTTGGGQEFRPMVIAFDVETGQRSQGDYLPPTQLQREMTPLIDAFARQFNRPPNTLTISPDGRLAAEFDQNGFVRLYRLTRTYDEFIREGQLARATLQADGVRSIGLAPTATAAYEAIGAIRPTLTPTPTIAAPVLAEATPPAWDESVTTLCPARTLFSLESTPPDYAAHGRLLAQSSVVSSGTWVIEPGTGHQYADAAIPRCVGNGSCAFSFDRQWIAQVGDGVMVSRVDGSQATTVIPPGNNISAPYQAQWLPSNILRIGSSGYLPEEYRGQIHVQRDFDPQTGRLSEPFVPLTVSDPVRIGELPIQRDDLQPGGLLSLVTTPYDSFTSKYYIYDRETDTAEYFARNLDYAEWDPLGRFLDYASGGDYFRFDAATRTHYQIPHRSSGIWSPDGRYRASSYNNSDDQRDRLQRGELPLKLQITDVETGAIRRYCVPQTGFQLLPDAFVWSPDGRYIAFTTTLPIEGDNFPTPGPTLVPYTTAPTTTPVPLEVQYQAQFPSTIILDTQTGYATVISTQATGLSVWTDDGGTR